MSQHIHLIAIGGSAMHNLAIALQEKGFNVTGSDDQINEPSRSRLQNKNLLPQYTGWNPDMITTNTEAVIVGMHAREDNPELKRALELGIKTYSYPEYLYEQTKDKKRIIIGGSHGKTTITSMIMHVLNQLEFKFDYMVGAQLEGFDTMVKLSKESNIAIFEGDEYLSSPLDLRPKFHHYYPDIAVLSGIAWDHKNVFPTFENYVEQFEIFISRIKTNGTLIYYNRDRELQKLADQFKSSINVISYTEIDNQRDDHGSIHLTNSGVELQIFGKHNLQNLAAAQEVCRKLNISDNDFASAIGSYKGAARRLQLIKKGDNSKLYYDFAHSPSKLKATIEAVREQFPNHKIVSCMELHTFSSLSSDFLPLYNGSMDQCDVALVYFNPEVIAQKRLAPLTEKQVKEHFNRKDLVVTTENTTMLEYLHSQKGDNTIFLIMTSGNFSGIQITELADQLID